MDTNLPITIVLVLRTGGDVYDYKYVNNLVTAIKLNLQAPHKIVLLTDDKRQITQEVDEMIRFHHDWPRWWGKIELFKTGLFGEEQIFFFDLDTFIVGSLNEIVKYRGEFCALKDFYRPHKLGSGMMSWHGTRMCRIYDEFVKHDRMYINNTPEGDQVIIDQFKPTIEYFPDVFPNEIVSYKVHCLRGDVAIMPPSAKVVCFHGKPRPHEITTNFKQYWNQ